MCPNSKVATSWSKKYFKELNEEFPGVKHMKILEENIDGWGKTFSSLQKQYVNPALTIKRSQKDLQYIC